ncbi:hypothetical protein MHU86_18892 [Fragilaria crotonensis]|nr:hypothetical protein MHU86_18892 [Fragilaria crotonensis]
MSNDCGVGNSDAEPIGRELDDFEAKNTRLDKLKRQNADRRAQLQQLSSQSQNSHNDDPMDMRAALLQELEQIPTLDEPNFSPDPRAFLREVVETHDELVQLKAILEEQLEHNNKMIGVNTCILEESREINAILVSRNKASQQAVSTSVSVNQLEEESLWLNDELAYLTSLLDRSGTSQNSGLWSLHKLVQELMRRYLASPSDPYLLVSVLPIHPNHIALLSRCHVIQTHEDNPDLVCLTDYLEEASDPTELRTDEFNCLVSVQIIRTLLGSAVKRAF